MKVSEILNLFVPEFLFLFPQVFGWLATYRLVEATSPDVSGWWRPISRYHVIIGYNFISGSVVKR